MESIHFNLSSPYATVPLLCISKWGDDVFLNGYFRIAICNNFWSWLTSSITFFMGNQGPLQILIWWMDSSQSIIDPLFEEK